MKKIAVIFDLDGTLLDSLTDLYLATNHALKAYGQPERTLDEVRGYVGNGVEKLIERAVSGGKACPMFDDILAEFKRYYVEHCRDNTRPYDGIMPMLRHLKAQGHPLAIVSNKLQAGVTELCDEHFSGVVSVAIGETASIRRKPQPEMIVEALRQLHVDKQDAVYVGDSEVDIATAQNSGLPCISVLWGFRSRQWLEQNGGNCFVATPEELERLLTQTPAKA